MCGYALYVLMCVYVDVVALCRCCMSPRQYTHFVYMLMF